MRDLQENNIISDESLTKVREEMKKLYESKGN